MALVLFSAMKLPNHIIRQRHGLALYLKNTSSAVRHVKGFFLIIEQDLFMPIDLLRDDEKLGGQLVWIEPGRRLAYPRLEIKTGLFWDN